MLLSKVAEAWAERLSRFDQAELTVAPFCKQDAVSQASFYKWRQRLRKNSPASQATQLIKPPLFIPSSLPKPIESSPQTKMTIELPGGIRIRFEIPGKTSQPSQTEAQS